MAKPDVQVIGQDDTGDLKTALGQDGPTYIPPTATPDEAENWEKLSTAEQLEVFNRGKVGGFAKISFEDALSEAVIAVPDVELFNKDNKDKLVGVPFIILRVHINQGNFGFFVSLTCVTKDNKTIVINDGSSGIASQMAELVQTYGTDKPISIPKGLKSSTYYVDNDTNKSVGKKPMPNSYQATTFYLDI
jgi:hypothetical protein